MRFHRTLATIYNFHRNAFSIAVPCEGKHMRLVDLPRRGHVMLRFDFLWLLNKTFELLVTWDASIPYKYSLLMHRIKIKSPANFFMEWIKRFCGWIYNFSISLTLAVLRQKSLPDIGGTTYYSRCRPLAHMQPGVHTMGDELILQISCNIFLAFKWILMMTSGQNISHYTTAKLSVHVWNHDLIWWQNKIDTQNISTGLRLRALEP